MKLLNICSLILIVCSIAGCNTQSENKSTLEEALASFEIEEGFKIELIASEPLIGDPVDMEIDESGRLFVVEMPGYPLDKSGSGKVKLLRDTDGDGRMDQSTTFAENLVLPNSIMRWKKGFLVTDAPYVLYFEDTNADDRADVRDTILTGFALSNPQHNLNSPMLSLDNWIYLAHEGAVSTETYGEEFGDPGKDVYFPGHHDSPRLSQNANGRAVRFRPDDLQLEELSSHTQFGHAFDRWGNYFLVGNANHIYHEVLPEPYLKRNTNLLLSNSTQSISDHGNAAEVFPITQNPQHQLLTDVGVITSACGLTSYNGGAFPAPYNDDITFVAEPVSNLIHVDKLKEAGATFTASRLKPHQEFLASRDPKFRPVNLYVGPDGALYVVDYYRQIIEHPEWMGKEVIESGELYNDADKGRIYRISAAGAKAPDWTTGLTLGNATDEELVNYLANANAWWRQNAQRLLVDRKNKASVNLLKAMTKHESPVGRLHALWTLAGLDELRPPQIIAALKDKKPGIRQNAVRMSEGYLSISPELIESLIALQSDPDSKVRFQLLCTLGGVTSEGADKARQQILFQDIDDKWIQLAALSAKGKSNQLLDVVIGKFETSNPSHAALLEKFASMMAASGEPKTIQDLIGYVDKAEKQNQPFVQSALLTGMAQGLQDKQGEAKLPSTQQTALLQAFFTTPHASVRKAILRVLKVVSLENEVKVSQSVSEAMQIAANPAESEDRRADAIDFISLRNPSKYSGALMKLFVPQEPLPVQLASLRTLSAIPDTTVSHYLLEKWPVLTPQLQDAAINTFLKNDERTEILLHAIENNKILPASISWPRRVRLMAQDNEKLRDRSRAIFTANNEDEVNKAYQSALHLNGDPEKGKIIYQQNCALCHQVRGQMGVAIGPDLGTVHNWSAEAILANTLSPGLSISSGFDLWSVELNDGETFQGIIASETPGAVTFRNTGSADRTINRKNIKSLKAMNMSIMPVGLDKQINQQEMADLLAFLKQNK